MVVSESPTFPSELRAREGPILFGSLEIARTFLLMLLSPSKVRNAPKEALVEANSTVGWPESDLGTRNLRTSVSPVKTRRSFSSLARSATQLG